MLTTRFCHCAYVSPFSSVKVVWENVRVLKGSGETVSVDGTHLVSLGLLRMCASSTCGELDGWITHYHYVHNIFNSIL